MANVDFTLKDFSPEVIAQLEAISTGWLEEAASEIESQTKRNTKVKTGQTKGSWGHETDSGKLEAKVVSRYKNAIYEEFGTGIYAEEGGRTTPWVYQADGKWWVTVGKKPRHPLKNAYETAKAGIEAEARRRFQRF